MADVPLPPTQSVTAPSARRGAFVGLAPPRPAPMGYTHGIPTVTIPTVTIPPLLPKSPPVWRPRRIRYGA